MNDGAEAFIGAFSRRLNVAFHANLARACQENKIEPLLGIQLSVDTLIGMLATQATVLDRTHGFGDEYSPENVVGLLVAALAKLQASAKAEAIAKECRRQ